MPYPPIDGGEVLDDIASMIGRYVAFGDEHALTAVALWAAHTHAPPKTWYVTPRLILDSAEPGSGKTRVLELLALLVQRPEMTISATVAAIFRMLAVGPHTLLFDEVDAIFAPKTAANYEDLRALLNAGYKQGSTIARCVGDAKAMRVERFPVFAPVALAGLAGRMPRTLTDRAVTIHMRRRAPGERIAPFRERDAEHAAEPLRARIAEWIDTVAPELSDARPEMPPGVVDRPAELWEALLAVADAAGGRWPRRARDACRHFVLDAKPGDPSLGVRLLTDLHALYAEQGADRMQTAAIVTALTDLDEAPWGDLWGRALDARRLARELDRYDVRPVQYRDADAGPKRRGYVTWATDSPEQSGLTDAWDRYLTDTGTPGTPGTEQVSPDPGTDDGPVRSGTAGTAVPAVPDRTGTAVLADKPVTCSVPPVPGVPAKCALCGEPLLVVRPGRTLCERCRLATTRSETVAEDDR